MNSEVCKVHFARKGEPEMGLTFIVSCTKHVLVELYHLPLPSPSVSPPRSSSLNDSANVAVRSNPSMASRNGSIGEAPHSHPWRLFSFLRPLMKITFWEPLLQGAFPYPRW